MVTVNCQQLTVKMMKGLAARQHNITPNLIHESPNRKRLKQT